MMIGGTVRFCVIAVHPGRRIRGKLARLRLFPRSVSLVSMTPPATHRPTAGYRPDIDGLRAVAVLAVMVTHLGIFARGGFVGVDVFFVISGYLITRLIRRDLEAGTFSLADFWERRVRRILPALVAVTAAATAAGWWLLLPVPYASLADSLSAVSVLSSNFHFWKDLDYFAPGSDQRPLLHTWSLAVEEQFYLGVPLLLMGLMRRGKSRLAVVCVLGLALASLGLSIVLVSSQRPAAFYLLPARAWELFAGVLLALREPRWEPRPSPALDLASLLGLALVLVPVCAYSARTRFPGLGALPPVCGAALLVWAGSGSGRLPAANRWLAARWLVSIGLWSYSIYLWHWPLLVFWRALTLRTTGVGEKVLLLTVSLALGYLSWRWIESPFRKRRVLRSRRSLFAAAGATLAVMLVSGLLVRRFDGVPDRLSPEMRRVAATSRRDLRYMVRLKPADIPGGLGRFGDPAGCQQILVWGDSHAMCLLAALDAAGRDQGVTVLAATRPGSVPVLTGYPRKPEDRAFCAAVAGYIRRSRVRTVLIAGRWANHRRPGFAEGLSFTVKSLRSWGVRVLVVNDVPEYPWLVPNALAAASLLHRSPAELALPPTDHEKVNRHYFALIPRLRALGAEIVDPLEQLPRDARGRFLPYDAGGSLYYDSNHLSTYGAMTLKPLFDRLLRRIASAPMED